MAEKKKKKMEFRYYQLPPGSPILALLGEKWVQNYGDRTADRLHFHNYMELGYCYYGAGDVVLGDDTYRFSGHMHMGPLEYINTVRIRTACEHLKKTEEPVADIAHKCGFTTNSTFNRNFKQMMGVTPVEWRKRPENYEQRLLNYEIHTEKGW